MTGFINHKSEFQKRYYNTTLFYFQYVTFQTSNNTTVPGFKAYSILYTETNSILYQPIHEGYTSNFKQMMNLVAAFFEEQRKSQAL